MPDHKRDRYHGQCSKRRVKAHPTGKEEFSHRKGGLSTSPDAQIQSRSWDLRNQPAVRLRMPEHKRERSSPSMNKT
jgi:hypothetical protein